MRAIFTHPQFLSPQAKQGLAKTPIEFVVGVMRATGIDSADAHPERFLKAMGMLPFEPPNVSGWSQNSYWVSATAFYGRADFLAGVGTIVHANTAPNAKPLPNVVTQTAQQAVNDAFNTFGVVDPTPQTRASLEGWLTTQKLAKTESYVERQFLIKLVCLSPEYQMA